MSWQSLTGTKFGQYELRELLGKGGMGAVYKAYQVNLKRIVAVKILPEVLANEPDYLTRFTREATTAASLEHPHIVTVHDFGTQDGISYVVMRLLTGGSLNERLLRRAADGLPPSSLGEAAQFLNQVASALDYAHSEGIIHRDIKPANVMFDNQGSAYLVDFGISKLLGETNNITAAGVVIGTPAYMSPEQWMALDLTPATDQYALGVMMYELITQHLPFDAPTPLSLMNKAVNEAPTPPNVWQREIPEAVALVLNRAMAKKPEDRFPTNTSFAQAFEGAIQGREGYQSNIFVNPLPPKTLEMNTPASEVKARPRFPIPLILGTAVVAIALVGGILFFVSRGGGDSGAQMLTAVGGTQVNGKLAQVATVDTPTRTSTATFTHTPTSVPPTATPVPLTNTLVPPSATAIPPTETLISPTAVPPTETPILPSVTPIPPTVTLIPTETPIPPTPVPIAPVVTQVPTVVPTLAPGTTRTTANGISQVWVPAGCFQMGSDPKVDKLAQGNEQPAHQVCLTQGYWIDQYEVTNAAYQKFIAAGGYSKREYWPDDKGWNWLQDGGIKGPVSYKNFTNADQPRVGISWYEATAYALWSGCQLPTEAQWEYAARGPQALIYPWGNDYAPGKGNIHTGKTEDVGRFTADKSWVNAFDMAGNAWEWTADWYDKDYYKSRIQDDPKGPSGGERHTIRGGVFYYGPEIARLAVRPPTFPPDWRDSNIGFRTVCAN